MADVFISYSRRDRAYVRHLQEELRARGKDVWVDVEGIRDGEVFPAALRRAIEGSDSFVFVISPDSVHSEFCEQEVRHASELNKRIVPLVLREVPDIEIPNEIRFRHWIPAAPGEPEFRSTVERLLGAIDTDLAWEHQHTRLTVKALEWEQAGRDRSFLLRGSELAAAERWLAAGADKDPGPTALEQEYLLAARTAASRRQRSLVGASLVAVVISVGLLVFALISRGQAISARNGARAQARTAKSQALAAESETQLSIDPERSILLAAAAVRNAPTSEAMFALRAAIDASPIRHRLPDAGVQQCAAGGVNGAGVASPGMAFTRQGRQLAEGLCDGTIVFADARTGRVIRRVFAGAPTIQIAFAPGGMQLGAVSAGRFALIDAGTGAIRRGPRVDADTRPVFDRSGWVLAVAGPAGVTLWNTRTGRTRVLRGPARLSGSVSALALSRDGRHVMVGLLGASPGQSGLLLGDLRTARVVAASTDGAADAAFSPNGRELAVADGDNGQIMIRDARTLKRLRTLVTLADVATTAVAFSPDGSRVAYGAADGTAGLVSASGERVAAFLGQTAAISQVVFAPDGRLVATASSDGTLRVWHASGLALSATSAPNVVALGAAIGAFVTLNVAPTGVTAQRWSDAGRPLAPPLVLHPNQNVDAAFLSGDGRWAGLIVNPAPQLAPVSIWSVAGRQRIATVPPSIAPQGGEPVLSPDRQLVAMGKVFSPSAAQESFVLVDANSGRNRPLATTSCSRGWRGYVFNSTSTLVAAGSFCGEVHVWNTATGKPVGHPVSLGGELADIAFSPDSKRIAIASWNSTIKVADVADGRVIATLTNDTRGDPQVTYSPNGSYLATASLDHTVRIWDAQSLTLLRVLTHPDPVEGLAFTPDSRNVLTFDGDSVVREWDACTDCENPQALLALARTRVTRSLTAEERRTFGLG